jgi:carboxyl-terminal processing protease
MFIFLCPRALLASLLALMLPLSLSAQAPSLSDQANAAYNAHQYAESAALYRQALPSLVDAAERADAEYNLACSEALAGQSSAALIDLAASVRDGYVAASHISSDSDLTSLHADPRFAAVVATARAARAQDDRRWGTAAFKTAYAPNISGPDKLAGLSLVWAEVKFSFGNAWHVPDLDWDKLYRETIPQVLATKTTFDYYRALQHMVAQLHDGHTDVYMPDDALHIGDLPFTTTLVEDRVLVLRVFKTEAAQGVQPGDEILTVNGEPVRPWALREVQPYQSASTPQDLAVRTFGYFLFEAPGGTAFTLTVSHPGGASRKLHFTAGDYYTPNAPFEFRMLPGNIAYVALNEFGDDEDSKQWDSHWSEISKASGIILDLRRNGGGSDGVGFHVLATLIDKPVPSSLVRPSRWVASLRAWGRIQTPLTLPIESVPPDPQHHFTGPVAMLTGPRTYSAGEDMVVAFRTAHRGSIVGEPTGGSTGQPLQFDLPGGGTARVCTLHDSFADGAEFVGVGVAPDILVPTVAADITGTTDTALTRAEAALHQPSSQ